VFEEEAYLSGATITDKHELEGGGLLLCFGHGAELRIVTLFSPNISTGFSAVQGLTWKSKGKDSTYR
jgi:hypothetical protein